MGLFVALLSDPSQDCSRVMPRVHPIGASAIPEKRRSVPITRHSSVWVGGGAQSALWRVSDHPDIRLAQARLPGRIGYHHQCRVVPPDGLWLYTMLLAGELNAEE